MKEKKQLHISVRSLVEFLLRTGDLTTRSGSFADKEAMQKGSRLHRKIQKLQEEPYQSEVFLKYEKEYENFVLVVDGRADGIIHREDEIIIDEIKGVYMDLEYLQEPVPVHLAQAKCYAYLYCINQEKSKIKVQMTYGNLETEEIRRFMQEYCWEDLEQWFQELLAEYHRWVDFQYRWQEKRNHSMTGLEFPFPYRQGQRELVSGVYRTISRKKQLFIQAPTGVGKTMSAVFPAVRSMGEGLAEKVFYLTAKTITRTVAEEAFSVLEARGLCCKVLTLTAKEKLCVCDETDCNPEYCSRAKGHYDRINEAVYELWTQEDHYTREKILAHSEKWQVCPYEMCLDLAFWVDAVICDYNYVFDPRVRLRRFFGEGNKGEYVFLIDEAHNLVDRGREMYSAVLYKEDFLEVKRMVRPYHKKLERLLERCNHQMLVYKRECPVCEVLESAAPLMSHLMSLAGEMEIFLRDLKDGELRKRLLEFYFQIHSFLMIYDLLDENYLIYTRHDENGKFLIRLFCVTPAENLQACLNKGRSAVFFSATLLPVTYYKRMFSTNSDDYAVYAESPFASDRRKIVIGNQVSSRYKSRNQGEYEKIARYIREITSPRIGNYMIFFPSYRLMEDVFACYCERYGEETEEYLLQRPDMQEKEREEFLAKFGEKGRNQMLLAFCVMGGIFAEGIDLTGEQLIGAIIIGTGIPQVSVERELLKQFYDKKGENGFDYAYRFPGMNKVLQSAGRVIRTAEDRGIVALLDERFLQAEYRRLFPREWEQCDICSTERIGAVIQEFWEKN